MAGGVAPHILVQRGFAAPIDLEAALGVVGDAALARRDHPDQARRVHQVLKSFHSAHHAERVGEHHTHELIGRDLRDRLGRVVVGGAGVDEQHVECTARKSFAQARDLIGLGDVERLDRNLIGMRVREIMQFGAAALPSRADDVPALLHELARHRRSKAA